MTASGPTVVLVHGAWHGAWCWQRVIPLLAGRNCAVRTVELPSVGAAPNVTVGLDEDAAAVRAVISAISGPVLLCGHSYGGMVISRASYREPRVSKLVYLCAFVPESGESLVTIGGGRLAPWIQLLDGGLTRPDAEQAAALFYADCDASTQSWAIGNLRPQCGAPFADAVSHPGWKQIQSTYVVCAADRAMPPDWQRELFAPRLNKVVELTSSHSPFLSQPDILAEVLASEVRD
jgi:pimeloyl-ACP methyl ester carboxylesterase